MSRKRLPRSLRHQILYESAWTCCVCRIPKNAVQVHHIDEDTSNNVENNLVALCQDHHDEAHTTHKLSQNLTQSDLKQFKARWNQEVKERVANSMLQKSNSGNNALWTYVNHDRLFSFLSAAGISYQSDSMDHLLGLGAVDKFGIIQPLCEPSENKSTWTVYDYAPYRLGYPLLHMYVSAVDDLILNVNPIDIDAIWTRTQLKALITPGKYLYSFRGFYFKDYEEIAEERYSMRLCYSTKQKIRVEFRVNTRHMFGDSSLYVSFSGHRTAAVLLLFKSFSEVDGILVLHCTPVAMGTGFHKEDRDSPLHLKEEDEEAEQDETQQPLSAALF